MGPTRSPGGPGGRSNTSWTHLSVTYPWGPRGPHGPTLPDKTQRPHTRGSNHALSLSPRAAHELQSTRARAAAASAAPHVAAGELGGAGAGAAPRGAPLPPPPVRAAGRAAGQPPPPPPRPAGAGGGGNGRPRRVSLRRRRERGDLGRPALRVLRDREGQQASLQGTTHAQRSCSVTVPALVSGFSASSIRVSPPFRAVKALTFSAHQHFFFRVTNRFGVFVWLQLYEDDVCLCILDTKPLSTG